MEIILVALENRMLGDLEHNVQIAGRAAVDSGLSFLGEPQLRAVVDAGWNVDLELAFAVDVAFAFALFARTADDLATPSALRARPADREKRLLVDHLAAAAAHGTRDQAIFGFGAFASAAPALFKTRYLNIGGKAAHRVFEPDLEIVTDVLAALRAMAPLARSASENVTKTKNIAEDIAQIGETVKARAGNTLVAEAVVGCALLRIAQDGIGFGRLFEFLFSLMVAGIPVGMKLQGKLAIGAFQPLLVAVTGYAENLVIIALRHAHFDAG